MVERIRQLLETRQLTPTQFADAIGIARPIVSHILSGRNKPSLEVVQRILAAMPDLSMPWLLNGTGPMQAGAALALPSLPVAQAPATEPVLPQKAPIAEPVTVEAALNSSPPRTQPSVPKEPAVSITKAASSTPRPPIQRFTTPAAQPKAELGANPPAQLAPAASEVPETPNPSATLPPQPDTQATPAPIAPATVPTEVAEPTLAAGMGAAATLFAGSEKPIRRIVIFYRDGSFADYQPE